MAKPATAVVLRTFPSNVGVPEHNRQALIALLNARLADSFDLRSQVKWAHWNLKGRHFIQLHELFDSIASHLEEQTDTIAERVATLGGVANGTASEVAARSGLKEADLTASDGAAMLKFLVHNVAHHANCAPRYRNPLTSATLSPAIFSPRLNVNSTRIFGSWRPTCNPDSIGPLSDAAALQHRAAFSILRESALPTNGAQLF